MKRQVVFITALLLAGCGYGRIQELDDRVQMARSEIEVQLKRQAELVPNLIETVRAYVAVDPESLEALGDARSRLAYAVRGGDLEAMGEAAADLTLAIQRLLALAAQDSALLGDPGFELLSSRLRGTRVEMDAACRDYNEAVAAYNAYIHSFPQVMTARVMGAEPQAFFQLD